MISQLWSVKSCPTSFGCEEKILYNVRIVHCNTLAIHSQFFSIASSMFCVQLEGEACPKILRVQPPHMLVSSTLSKNPVSVAHQYAICIAIRSSTTKVIIDTAVTVSAQRQSSIGSDLGMCIVQQPIKHLKDRSKHLSLYIYRRPKVPGSF